MTVEVLRDGAQIAVQMPRQAMPAGFFDVTPMGGETRAISVVRDAPPAAVSGGTIVVGGSAKRVEAN
jgi:hypothetical protein